MISSSFGVEWGVSNLFITLSQHIETNPINYVPLRQSSFAMSTNEYSIPKRNPASASDHSDRSNPLISGQESSNSGGFRHSGQQRSSSQSGGNPSSGRSRSGAHQRPSNIGKNQNPVLVMTSQDQKTKISHLQRHSQGTSTNRSTDQPGRHRRPHSHTNLLDEESFPETLGSHPSQQPETASNEGNNSLKFGSIDSKLPRLDYSKIATMHAAQKQATSANLEQQAAQGTTDVPPASANFLPRQPEEVAEKSGEHKESSGEASQHPHDGQFAQQQMPPMQPQGQVGPRMGHPFPSHGQYPMPMGPYPMAPWMNQPPHGGHPYMPNVSPSFPHQMQQYGGQQPIHHADQNAGQQMHPYPFPHAHAPAGGSAPMRMMPPMHHPSMLPMLMVPPGQQQPPQVSMYPERKKILLDFRDPVTGAAVLDDEVKPAGEEKAKSTEEEAKPVESSNEVKIILIEPEPVAKVESQFIPEEGKSEQTVLIDQEPELLERVVEKMQLVDLEEPTDSLLAFEHDEQEEGEVEPREFILLESNESVSYPANVTPSIVKKGARRQYAIAFLMQFQSLCTDLPEDTTDGEYLTNFSGTIGTNYLQLAQTQSRQAVPGAPVSKLSMRYPSSIQRKSSLSGVSSKIKSGSGRRISTTKPSLYGSEVSSSLSLHQAENAWSRSGARSSELSDHDEQIKRQFIGILNKLSRENFQPLYEQIKSLEFNSCSLFSEIISKIYDKAVDESSFAELYAALVLRLSQDYRTFPDVKEEVVAKTGSVTRALLLGRCQTEYYRRNLWNTPSYQTILDTVEIPSHIPLDKPDDMSIEDYWRAKLRKRSLGNIKFVGELFKLGIIHENIILTCIKGLLEEEQPGGEELESLTKMLVTTGARLDSNDKIRQAMNEFFIKIESLSKATYLNSRIRFQLLDLIELRQKRWGQSATAEQPTQTGRQQQQQQVGRKVITRRTSAHSPSIGAGESATAQQAKKTSPPETPQSTPKLFTATGNQSKFSLLNDDESETMIPKPVEEKSDQEEEDESVVDNSVDGTVANSSVDATKLQQQVKSALKEYFIIKDPVELVLSFDDSGYSSFDSNTLSLIISFVTTALFESTKIQETQLLLSFFSTILNPTKYLDELRSVTKNPSQPPLFSTPIIKQGIYETVESLEDILMDAPKALQNVSLLIGCLCENGVFSDRENAIKELNITNERIMQSLKEIIEKQVNE